MTSRTRDRHPPVAAERARSEPSGGTALEPALRTEFEQSLGTDLSTVRIHPTEPDLAADAMTRGPQVSFSPGVFQPRTPTGRRTLAHELVHVVQQSGGTGGGELTEEAAERQAEDLADRLVAGDQVGPIGTVEPGTEQFANQITIRSQGFRPSPTPLQTGAEGSYHLDLDWNGDHLEVGLSRRFPGTSPNGVRLPPELSTQIRYVGPHVVDRRSVQFSDRHPAVTADAPIAPGIIAVTQSDAETHRFSKLLVDVTGRGAAQYEISNLTSLMNAWVPPVRRHELLGELTGTYHGMVNSARAMTVREEGALPTEDNRQLEAMLALPRPDFGKLSTLQLLHLAEHRLHDIRPAAWAFQFPTQPAGSTTQPPSAGGTGSTGTGSTVWHRAISDDLTAVVRRFENASGKPADDEAIRRRAGELARVSAQAASTLPELAKLTDPRLYLGNTEAAAVRLVQRAIGSTIAAVVISWADLPARLAVVEREALRHRLALPYDLAGLYLREGKGVEAVQDQLRAVSFELWQWRDKAGLRSSRPMDEILLVQFAAGSTAGSVSAGQQAGRLARQREAFYTGAVDVFATIGDLTQRTQREAGLFALFALWAQMTWFRSELDSWLDTVVGVLPGTNPRQRPVAQDYKDQFGRMVGEVEAAWQGGWTPAFETVVDGVLQRFVGVVTPKKFNDDINTMADRLTTIEVIKLVGKVLALIAVAALAAWAAGAGVGALLSGVGRGLALSPGLTTAIAKGGAFLAEVTVFTIVSRAENDAFMGGNTTTFLEDWGTNFLLFRLLRFTSGVYAARWTQLARMARPATYAAGHAAVSVVSLQTFAEIHHLLKQGKVMSGEERFRVVFNNLVLVTTMQLGSHIVTAPESRIPAPVLDYVRRMYGTRFKVLEGRRKALGEQLDKLRKDQTSADVGEILKELESLYNTEFQLIARAAQRGGFSADQVKAALDSYARPIRGLEIEFARMGMEFGTPEAAMFRPIGAQIVEYRPAGLPFLRDHYRAAKGDLSLVGEGIYRGIIQGEIVYWIPRGGPLPQGGMRGRDVFPLAAEPILQPSDVVSLRAELIRYAQLGGLRHLADFGPIPFPDSNTMRVPLEGGGYATVRLHIELVTPSRSAAHGLESGHARNHLTFENGSWVARIEIDPRLRAEDAQIALRHEVNEVAGIARRLHGRGLTGRPLQEAILAQQQSALTREGARGAESTEHDIATTLDLIALFERYQADPSPLNRTTLDNQIRQMGFSARYFAQELAPRAPGSTAPNRTYTQSVRTRDELIRDHAPTPQLGQQLLDYIDLWRTQTFTQTPFVAADRPFLADRLREYGDALAGRTTGQPPFRQATPEATMDVIEMLAQAALGRDRVTAADLIQNGMSQRTANRVVAAVGGRNPYRTLYPELESLIAIRHRVTAARARGEDPQQVVGYGFVRELTSVRAMTAGGTRRLDGATFAEVMRRLDQANEAGLIKPHDEADPLRPQFNEPTDATSAVRLTWRFRAGRNQSVDSLFSIDLPGVVGGRPFQLGDLVHADLEPLKAAGGHATEHVTETGVVVPAGSAPAHIWIRPDGTFRQLLDAWGLRPQRTRFQTER